MTENGTSGVVGTAGVFPVDIVLDVICQQVEASDRHPAAQLVSVTSAK